MNATKLFNMHKAITQMNRLRLYISSKKPIVKRDFVRK